MRKLLLLFGVSCLAASSAAADEAAAFFDDSAVREIRLYFDDPNWYNTLFQAHSRDPNDPYFPARFQYGSIVLPKIGARFKGHSSFMRNGIKKPFKLDFNEYDENATFLGLKKLNLHNGDLQPDFLHEKLFLDFAGKYIAAMRAVHVRLYVNDAYYGLYLAVEQPDKTMMRSRFGNDEDGNLYEAGENVAANMSYLGPDRAAYTSRYELKTNEAANDYSGLIQMLDILNNAPLAELPERLEPVMDIENVLYGMALNNLFTNLESYLGTASEYYLYQRSRDNRFVHIHWDTNETFGSTGDGTPRLANPFTMDPFYLPAAGGFPAGASNARPLLQRLWAVDAYKRLYLQMLARFLREGFDEAAIGARSQELANRFRADYAADPNKAYTMTQFETALTRQVTANGFTTYGLTQFVRERSAYLRPLLNSLAQPSDVRLNEVVTVNGGAHRDTAGDADPWVELYNLGPGPVSTQGFYLTDDQANPTKWALPARTLSDGQYLVLWLDGEPGEGDTHAGFRLGTGAGRLWLYSSAGGGQALLDSVAFGAMPAGQAYVRTGLYGSNWSVTGSPTPGAENVVTTRADAPVSAGTGRLLINEFMADNDGAYPDPDEPGAFDDWFEIYNPGSSAVDMSGMYISDSLNNPTKWKVPDGVTVPGGGYVVFLADGQTSQGIRHAGWSLSADGESISIYETDGQTLVDRIVFGPQRTDVAMGRTSDGAASWSLFSPGTPGAPNVNPVANWVVNGAGYQLAPVAVESIVSAFAAGLASATTAAATTPLPTTLGGVTVTVTDKAGTARQAPLYFVSPNQLNFQVPEGTVSGKALLSIRKEDGSRLTGDVLIDAIGPGLFSANADGTGVGLMAAVRADAQGNQTVLPVFRYDAGEQKLVAVPVDLGAASDQVYLVLYATGVRKVSGITRVTASVGGTSVPVTYAGAQNEFQGLDQVNIGPLPRSLAGRGVVNVYITVDGNRSNTVTVHIQ
jgi:uncharacterized protein (TIGR03437 family)